jgi:hypothetical protein
MKFFICFYIDNNSSKVNIAGHRMYAQNGNMRWLIIFLAISSTAVGQRVLEGTVVDAISGAPIPYASVVVVGTLQGTSSNVNGQFSISVAESFSLRITCIGYESQVVNSPESAELVKLAPTATQLDAIIVSNKPIRPKLIVTRALNKISDNYSTQPFFQKFFYRHYCMDGDTYGRLIEASVDVWKDRGYRFFRTEAGQQEGIRVTQLRRSLDKTKMAQGHEPIAIKNILETDLVGYQIAEPTDYVSFFSNVSTLKSDIDKYSFNLKSISDYDGEEVYNITYLRKDSILTASKDYKIRARIEGTLTITTANHVIIKREEVRSQDKDTIRTSTRYVKHGDRYYPYHFLVTGNIYDDQTRIHSFHIELMAVDVSNDISEKFAGNLPGREELLNVGYDSAFWTSHTILKTTPLEEEIIQDLGGGISLNEQFLRFRQYEMNTTNLGKDGEKKFNWFREYNKGNQILYLTFWSDDVKHHVVPIELVKRLHRQYRDNITFVFLSLVDDEALWEQLVQKYNLSSDGILNYRLGSHSKLARSLSVSQAPAFILIGRDGGVIDADARPSDPAKTNDLKILIGEQ